MSYKNLIMASVAILVVSCGGGGTGSTGGSNGSTFTDTSSTFTDAKGAQETTPPTSISKSTAEPAVPDMIVNPETREVYLSTTGWLSEEAFWDIYYNDPTRLPSNLDWEALAQYKNPEPQAGQ